ncbi:MAG: 30S ribosomal protein S9 [Flavobacteriales bacterium]|jgi:small subunit ribosomal protein S9|uniref:30S ribosomal protein S9 n=1 Tax=Blattabacterium sp. (Mastotermes darwiniensis) TaxID=39768 RepID=UPI000231DE7C|nr:30S ribosomal protein S9 [Blattabacterium sp. (Mastotermes darwiniensis)]AER40688.1 30S ribosomal protein S9 [Blattabacterium sp. (Mastotermes darwiniensis) str. MADAR]MDR1804784.1 30S ribosomal protein S9 [Flavobacteriales bacterium]
MIHTIGRRKRSLARIYLRQGEGSIMINTQKYEQYFPKNVHVKVLYPLKLIDNYKFDITIQVNGGGFNGQAEAICLAISRALCQLDFNNRNILKKKGLLTRDSREVERKKFGQKKARKRFQFSKR